MCNLVSETSNCATHIVCENNLCCCSEDVETVWLVQQSLPCKLYTYLEERILKPAISCEAMAHA